MSNRNIKFIDAEFKNQLLAALELVHQEQVRKAANEEEKFRADFLKIWHYEWIIQDLSGINPKMKQS